MINNLKATKRENTKSSYTNKLRATGLIPAILYGGNTPNLNIAIEKKSLQNIIGTEIFLI